MLSCHKRQFYNVKFKCRKSMTADSLISEYDQKIDENITKKMK
jgi:hypothetical protein